MVRNHYNNERHNFLNVNAVCISLRYSSNVPMASASKRSGFVMKR